MNQGGFFDDCIPCVSIVLIEELATCMYAEVGLKMSGSIVPLLNAVAYDFNLLFYRLIPYKIFVVVFICPVMLVYSTKCCIVAYFQAGLGGVHACPPILWESLRYAECVVVCVEKSDLTIVSQFKT